MGQPITLYKDGKELIVYGVHQANVHLEQGWSQEEAVTSSLEKDTVSSPLSIGGIPVNHIRIMKDAGYITAAQIANATINELSKIKGIGKKTAAKYIAAAQGVVNDSTD